MSNPLPRPRGADQPPEAELPPMMDLGDEDDWKPPANLAAPDPLPGMVQRWVRTGVRNDEDVSNVYRMQQLGWTPRPASTVKGGVQPPTLSHGNLAGAIGIQNMVLMHMPIERVDRLKRHNRAMIDRQMLTIDQDIAKVNSKQVQFTDDSRFAVTRAKRRATRVMDD